MAVMATRWWDGRMAEWSNGKNGGRMAGLMNGGRMAEWSNGGNGYSNSGNVYLPTIL